MSQELIRLKVELLSAPGRTRGWRGSWEKEARLSFVRPAASRAVRGRSGSGLIVGKKRGETPAGEITRLSNQSIAVSALSSLFFPPTCPRPSTLLDRPAQRPNRVPSPPEFLSLISGSRQVLSFLPTPTRPVTPPLSLATHPRPYRPRCRLELLSSSPRCTSTLMRMRRARASSRILTASPSSDTLRSARRARTGGG